MQCRPEWHGTLSLPQCKCPEPNGPCSLRCTCVQAVQTGEPATSRRRIGPHCHTHSPLPYPHGCTHAYHHAVAHCRTGVALGMGLVWFGADMGVDAHACRVSPPVMLAWKARGGGGQTKTGCPQCLVNKTYTRHHVDHNGPTTLPKGAQHELSTRPNNTQHIG